ncbi:phage tail protein [Parasphingopyxis marina]|nr:phage tail protein [Parasphingopyxis marina]
MAKNKKAKELGEKELDQVTGGEVKQWNLENAWPSKVSGGGANGTADEFLSSGHTTGSNITGTGKSVVTEEIVFVKK